MCVRVCARACACDVRACVCVWAVPFSFRILDSSVQILVIFVDEDCIGCFRLLFASAAPCDISLKMLSHLGT